MDEIGFNISLSDYRLLFDQIDFDEAGVLDYFKFCLLDYDKVYQRDSLQKKYELQKVADQVGKHDFNDKNEAKFEDGNVPKNKDVNKFISAVRTKTFKQELLDKKEVINA